MLYSREDLRTMSSGHRMPGGRARRGPKWKVRMPEQWHLGKQPAPKDWLDKTACTGMTRRLFLRGLGPGKGFQRDGTRVAGWDGREHEDPFGMHGRRTLPAAQSGEAMDLEKQAGELLDQHGGMKLMPFIEDDPGVMQCDRRDEVYGAKPWRDLPPS